MKRLYNEYEAENVDGQLLSGDIERLLGPVIQQWASEGFSYRDIQSIIYSSVNGICATETIRYALKKKRSERVLELG